MAHNPLFPTEPDEKPANQPPSQPSEAVSAKAAADMIRHKLATIYANEPKAQQEMQEAAAAGRHRSKHQRFMHELQSSGKSLAEIQTAWHNYYVALPDAEKHQVWQEFYEANEHLSKYQQATHAQPAKPQVTKLPDGGVVFEHEPLPMAVDRRTPRRLKEDIKHHVGSRTHAETKKRSWFRSLGFGLSMGVLVIVIFLFSFFNEVIIAPFIQPSRHVNATPLIISNETTVAASATPEIIIPKINVEIPVDYSLTTDNENVIEDALEAGVVHYPSTVLPGQNGNAAFFGHSSNNIFNPGKYKFAFVLLHTLVKGDTFYLTYQGKVYVYQVIDTKIVPPSDVSVLNDTEGKQATATLITCDPPGTSINRLVVTGEQVSPSPSGNSAASSSSQTVSQPTVLASNGPSLWSRFWHWLF